MDWHLQINAANALLADLTIPLTQCLKSRSWSNHKPKYLYVFFPLYQILTLPHLKLTSDCQLMVYIEPFSFFSSLVHGLYLDQHD